MYLTNSVFAQLTEILDDICQEIEALPNIRLDMADQTTMNLLSADPPEWQQFFVILGCLRP
jgi:hypothetical protein